MNAGGAGMRAFVRAIGQIYDVTVDRKAINPDGKTDPLIAREFLAHCGVSQARAARGCQAG